MKHAPQTSEQITAAMATLRLNQPKLAKELGVNQGTVSKWVSGKSSPSKPVMKLIERLLEDARTTA